MTSSKDKRVAVTLAALALVLFAPILIWPLSNVGGSVLSLALEREPTGRALTGSYSYSPRWGHVSLVLKPDGTFEEVVSRDIGDPRRYTGRWNASADESSAKVDFQPFGMVWDDDHDREINQFAMSFYKRRFGRTYAKVDDDLGEQFEHE